MPQHRIKELRKAKGLTIDQLAVAAEISQSHMSRLEAGKRALMLPMAERLAGALGVRVAELLGIDEDQLASGAPLRGFSDDTTPYTPEPGDPLAHFQSGGNYLHTVDTDVVARAGLNKGEVARFTTDPARLSKPSALEIVHAVLRPAEDPSRQILLLRQFVPPGLLITNSPSDNLPSISMDEESIEIIGVVVGSYKRFRLPGWDGTTQ